MRLAYCKLDGKSGHEAGRLLLEQRYREETGEALPPILKTERGKPYFADCPYHFSISHTSKHAFCILSRENVAVDAEEGNRPVREKLVKKVLSPGELAQWMKAEDKTKAFLTFWVLKEAEAKLSGKGLQGYPNHTDFSLSDPRVREVDGCLVAIMTDAPQEKYEEKQYAF